MTARFEDRAIVVRLDDPSSTRSARVRLVFEGADNEVEVAGEARQESRYNFFVGADRARWRTDVPSYDAVRYRGLYDGIDVRVREQERRLEYDVLVAPGADLSRVVVRCEGVAGLAIDAEGQLVMHTTLGPIIQPPPRTWYELPSGERLAVECTFCLHGHDRYGFELAEPELGAALVIDPPLEWSTFVGGSGSDWIMEMAVDPTTGEVTVAGTTYPGTSSSYPWTDGAFDIVGDPLFGDGVVSRLTADGSALIWSTFLGGHNGTDAILEMAVDEAGVITVVGRTLASDFPTTSGAYDESFNGGIADAFAARLSDDGSQLLWSTFLGGAFDDRAGGVALDGDTVIVAGYTESQTFPTTDGSYDETYNGGEADAFVVRLDPTLEGDEQLVWSTYLGGNDEEGSGTGNQAAPNEWDYIETRVHDASGDIYVLGSTRSTNFPTSVDTYDASHNGSADLFVTRLGADGASLVWSTFLGGGPGSEWADDFDIDTEGRVTVVGFTYAEDFPTTDCALDDICGSGGAPWKSDLFIARLDPAASGPDQLVCSSCLGGQELDATFGMDMSDDGVITIGGLTHGDFPITPHAVQPEYAGPAASWEYQDALLARVRLDDEGCFELLYASYLGSSLNDGAGDVVSVGTQDVIMVAATASPGFPVTPGAHDTVHDGGDSPFPLDGAVLRVDLCPPDVDDDGTVAVTDLVAIVLGWGPCPGCDSDVNGDGVVDVADLVEVILSWGPCW